MINDFMDGLNVIYVLCRRSAKPKSTKTCTLLREVGISTIYTIAAVFVYCEHITKNKHDGILCKYMYIL